MSSIKLETTAILHVPINNYEQNFTFIINNKRIETNRLVADLLSPKISQYHLTDPTINEYEINTANKGDFNKIINLVQFNKITLQEDDIPFMIEIIENLETSPKSIVFETEVSIENNDESSISTIIQRLQQHNKYPHFYSNQISTEIDTISENFYQTSKEDKEQICTLGFNTVSRIIENPKLQIETEDDLIEMINKLYRKDSKYGQLYSQILFFNVSKEKMNEFIGTFRYGDITSEIWKSISTRLSFEIEKDESKTKENLNRYKNSKPKRKPVKTIHYSNQDFEGLINYLKKESNLKDEIELTAIDRNDYWGIFENKKNWETNTGIYDNAWICIGFKNHEINPTSYTIKSGYDSDNLKNFVIEGSNDKDNWTKLDEENNISYLKDKFSVHSFPIHNESQQTFKYLRIRITGPNWNNRSMLQLCSIEFYGELY